MARLVNSEIERLGPLPLLPSWGEDCGGKGRERCSFKAGTMSKLGHTVINLSWRVKYWHSRGFP